MDGNPHKIFNSNGLVLEALSEELRRVSDPRSRSPTRVRDTRTHVSTKPLAILVYMNINEATHAKSI